MRENPEKPSRLEAVELTETLRQAALSSYVTAFGTASFAGRDADAPSSLPFSLRELPYAVSIGFRLSDVVMDSLTDRPTRTYQYHYRQVNIFIDQTLLRLLSKIHELGFKGFPVPASQIVDWEANTGHLAHKVVARECGLGWIGRNNLLVSPDYGARMRYGSLFTNMPLEAEKGSQVRGAVEGASGVKGGASGSDRGSDSASGFDVWGCGVCRACARACPASAIGETRESFDLVKCTQMLKQFSKEENIGSMICGLCIKACKGTGSRHASRDRG